MDWSKACLLAETTTGDGIEATAGKTSAFAGSQLIRTNAPNFQFQQST